MTKAPLGGEKTGRNLTDHGKLGVKGSLLTECHGIPVGLAVDGANRNDMKMVRETRESISIVRPEATAEHPQGICLANGYDYEEGRTAVDVFGFTGSHPVAWRRSQ